jgi:hypothetical protein
MFKLILKNLTDEHKQINSGKISFILDPYQTRQIFLPPGTVILDSSNLDFTDKSRIKLINVQGSESVYVTNDGLLTSNKIKTIFIENTSCFPVYFVRLSNGKRWPICMLPPKTERKIETMINTQWEIVTPERPDIILGTFFLQNESTLTFNGEKLY